MKCWRGIIEEYRSFLPVTKKTPLVTLQEGATPLLYSEKLSKLLKCHVHLKIEGSNPTASFKDRGMTLAVSKAKESKAKAVICASTGNTSASAAAYAAKAGIACYVILPQGKVAMGKMSQALMLNARVIPIRGNFDDALTITRQITAQHPIALVNSLNPYRIEGQKTGAFEVCDQLNGKAPDFHMMPVGNAGNITAYWKGYKDYRSAKKIQALPRMLGFQAEGAAPIVRGKVVKNPKTFATAIRIGNPASWALAEKAKQESGGVINMVSDKKIYDAYRWLAVEEGIFVEPASAASVAGLFDLKATGYFKNVKGMKDKTAVCVLTGHGLKDPKAAVQHLKMPKAVDANMDQVMKVIKS